MKTVSATTRSAPIPRWASAFTLLSLLLGSACKDEPAPGADVSSQAAASGVGSSKVAASAPPSASAVVAAPRPWEKAIKRDLELRLGDAKLGEINIEWTPVPGAGSRSTVKSWMAMKVTTNDGAISRSENEENEQYDAALKLVSSVKVDRESGVEEREEVSIKDNQLTAKVKKPSHEDQKTLPLPERWRSAEDSNAMVIGGEKELRISSEPILRAYFTIFEDVLRGPDCKLLIIGYGFKDPHINQRIAEAVTNHGLKVFIISPIQPNKFCYELGAGPEHPVNTIWNNGLHGYYRGTLQDLLDMDKLKLSSDGDVFLQKMLISGYWKGRK